MSQMFLACAKCQQPMPVDESMVRNALLMGEALSVQHDVCPGDETAAPVETPPLRKFRVQVMVYEIPADIEEQLDGYEQSVMGEPRGTDDPPLDLDPSFTARIGVIDLEPLAGAGTTIEAESAASAIAGQATSWLNHVWPQVQQAAGFADATPATAD